MGLNGAQQQKIIDQATKKATEDATKKATEDATKAAGVAAKTEVEGQLKAAFGVDAISLDKIGPQLRPKVRDTEIDIALGTRKAAVFQGALPIGVVDLKTHRYTIDVPDEGEHTVLNLGHGDTGRDLPDPGISARTKSHIHLHTQAGATASMVALGGPTGAKRDGLLDPDDVLGQNHGIAAITNGRFWVGADQQLNLASHKGEAVLRAYEGRVRVQGDASNVEVGSGANVVVGGVKNVNIAAGSNVEPADNGYGVPFEGKLAESAGKVSAKDAVSLLDIVTSVTSVVDAMKKEDLVYGKGKLVKESKPNDVNKIKVDAFKVLSSAGRWIAGKYVDGQVKIAAETFASMTGSVASSVYGHLSASVTSMVSASLVGGTASVKGLKWASMWASSGVSIRTVLGSASVKSERGGVKISGQEEVNVTSVAGVNIGGDGYAELKSLKGHAYVGAPQTKVCAGRADGMGLLLEGQKAYLGAAAKADEAACSAKSTTFLELTEGKKPLIKLETTGEVAIKAKGSFMTFKRNAIHFKGKRADIL